MSKSLTVVCLLLLGAGAVFADTLWTATYAGPNIGDNTPCAVGTDTFNNVVVVGTSAGATGMGTDMVAVKYSWFHGNQLWVNRISKADTSDNVATAAVVSPGGSVTLTGQTGRSTNHNMLTVHLGPNGNEVWRDTYDGSAHGADIGMAIATDTAGNYFVAGCVQNSTKDYVVIKYNPDGTRAWVKTYDAGGSDSATAITLGQDGSIFVTGQSSSEFGTVKYTAAGTQDWVKTYNGPYSAPSWPASMAVDSSGSVYVTGTVRTQAGMSGRNQIGTVKYDSGGVQKWTAVYDVNGSQPAALALGPSAVYVTGWTPGTSGSDCVTFAYNDSSGDTLWMRRDSNDVPAAVAVGTDSSVWVAGTGNYDFMTVLYSPDGARHWVEKTGTAASKSIVAMSLDKNNKIAVTGGTWAGGGNDFLTVKFDTLPLGIAESRGGEPVSGLRLSVAPNPVAAGKATLRLGVVNGRAANLTVSGVDGRVVLTRTLAAGRADGTYPLDLTGFNAGVYMVRLESGGRSATQKLVVGR